MKIAMILRVEEISEILGISINTIQSKRWRIRTGCPLFKKGKRLYAYSDEFYKWFKEWGGTEN